MGQIFSSSGTNNGTVTPKSNTPQRMPTCVDPRSPTRDIDRTPIQVGEGPSTNENSPVQSSLGNEEDKPKRRSLRQKIFQNKNKNLTEKDVNVEDE